MRTTLAILSLGASLAACASGGGHLDVSPAEVPLPAQPASSGAEAAAPADDVDDASTPAVLTRDAVRAAVQRGIGHFLAGVELTPVVDGGRFRGFRLDHARGLRRWNAAGLAIRPGDVVTRINASPIERPEQAQAVFVRAATADAIIVDVLRDGAPVTLRIPVVDAAATVSDASAPR